jgi:hypothetical protein
MFIGLGMIEGEAAESSLYHPDRALPPHRYCGEADPCGPRTTFIENAGINLLLEHEELSPTRWAAEEVKGRNQVVGVNTDRQSRFKI